MKRLTDAELLQTLKDLVTLARRSTHPNYEMGCAWRAITFNRASLAIAELHARLSADEEDAA